MLWVPLLLPAVPALCYCTGVLLTIGHIYFLCSDHGSVVALVILDFVYFNLVATDGGFDWVVLGGF